MDSLTHIVLGAAIGELMAGRKLGKKALLIGAIANSLPDIDFVASFWLDPARDAFETHLRSEGASVLVDVLRLGRFTREG